MTLENLKARIQLLEFAGDDGIISDWVYLNEEELREEYEWVAKLPPGMIRLMADAMGSWAKEVK